MNKNKFLNLFYKGYIFLTGISIVLLILSALGFSCAIMLYPNNQNIVPIGIKTVFGLGALSILLSLEILIKVIIESLDI